MPQLRSQRHQRPTVHHPNSDRQHISVVVPQFGALVLAHASLLRSPDAAHAPGTKFLKSRERQFQVISDAVTAQRKSGASGVKCRQQSKHDRMLDKIA